VASHNSGPGLLTEEEGMGIRFVHLSEEQGEVVDQLYQRCLQKAIAGDSGRE